MAGVFAYMYANPRKRSMAPTHPRTHVRSHASRLGAWRMAHRAPGAALAPFVLDLCDYAETTAFTRRREMPEGDINIVFNLGPPLKLLDVAGVPETAVRDHAFVAGIDDATTVVETTGTQRGVQLRLTPIGAARFLRLPMEELTGRVVRLEEVLGTGVESRLHERLQAARTEEERLSLIEALVVERLAEAPAVLEAVSWAWARLRARHGQLGIGALATEIGWSRKHFLAQFRRHIGLPPKKLARLLRFRRVMRLTARLGAARWAEIAERCGYADQAHLIRDFQQFAGGTPGDFLRHLLPDGGGVRGE